MGVAHDRQQRIKEKCDQRRHSTDRADERDEKREEGERRYRLDHADSAENRLRRQNLWGVEQPAREFEIALVERSGVDEPVPHEEEVAEFPVDPAAQDAERWARG